MKPLDHSRVHYIHQRHHLQSVYIQKFEYTGLAGISPRLESCLRPVNWVLVCTWLIEEEGWAGDTKRNSFRWSGATDRLVVKSFCGYE